MSTLQEIEASAQALPADQRAQLVTRLLGSLPPVLDDDDGGMAEAHRRDTEMNTEPAAQRSEKEFLSAVLAARKR